jgi:hypothetical protein
MVIGLLPCGRNKGISCLRVRHEGHFRYATLQIVLRIVFDWRMMDDPASMSLTIPAHARLRDDFR